MIIVVDSDINEMELMVVLDRLEKRGTKRANIYKGNNCIWVASGSASRPLNEYFVFCDGRPVDHQMD